MAKGRGRPKRSDREDMTVKMGRAVVTKAKLVAGHLGIPLAELLTDLAGPAVDRAYLKMLRDLEGKGGPA